MIETVRQWQCRQMFKITYAGSILDSRQTSWNRSISGDGIPFVTRLLFDKPARAFLDAVLVVMRGLYQQVPNFSRFNQLVKLILNQVVRLDKETNFSWAVKSREVREHVIHLLYSWYVTQFFEEFQVSHGVYRWERQVKEHSASTLEVLRLFCWYIAQCSRLGTIL